MSKSSQKLQKSPAPPNPPTPSNPSNSSKSADSYPQNSQNSQENLACWLSPGLGGIQTALKGMADHKNKLTGKIAKLELSVLIETAEGVEQLVVALKNKLVKIAELEKR